MPPFTRKLARRKPPIDSYRWPAAAFERGILFTEVIKFGVSAWRFEWAPTTGPYQIYLLGELIEKDYADTSYLIDLLDYTAYPPPLEIIDANGSSALVNSYLYPPFSQLQWYGVAGAVNYYVYEYVDTAYVRRQIVNENGQGYHVYRTAALADGSQMWKVTPVDEYGNEGTEIEFTFTTVSPPLPPDAVPISYDDSSQVITVGP